MMNMSPFWKGVLGTVAAGWFLAVTAFAADKAVDVIRLEVRVANIEDKLDEVHKDVKSLLAR